jgi:hypothetical protein
MSYNDHLLESPHYVYRCYDADGDLLYVGCTVDVKTRMPVHHGFAENGGWPDLVTRVESDVFPNRAAGWFAEKEAILAGEPIYNMHRPVSHYRAIHGADAALPPYLTEDQYTRRGRRRDHWLSKTGAAA